MPILTANLPAPAGVGSGAAASTANIGFSKVIAVSGTLTGASVNIEVSAGGSSFCPVVTFTSPGTKQIGAVADEMRVTVTNGDASGATIDVGGIDATLANSFTMLPVTAGDGSGASVDLSTAGAIRTFVVQATGDSDYAGTLTIEGSLDDVNFVPTSLSFQSPDCQSQADEAYPFLRVTRNNTSAGGGSGTPVVWVGAENIAALVQPNILLQDPPPGAPPSAAPLPAAAVIPNAILLFDTSGGAIAQPLPLAASLPAGTGAWIKEIIPGAALTVTPTGGDTIDLIAGPFAIAASGANLFVTDGMTNWIAL
ncbi:MAG: hypothetical protein R3322_00305 [Kiloniellales bacterium]|nr:hypothetical protein [Kiloniellales bacterium]